MRSMHKSRVGAMTDWLHKIREEHASDLANNPELGRAKPLPENCPHCGGPFPVKLPDAAKPGYRLVRVEFGETRYDTKIWLESGPCDNCGKTIIFEH